jgi:hypothetical protein
VFLIPVPYFAIGLVSPSQLPINWMRRPRRMPQKQNNEKMVQTAPAAEPNGVQGTNRAFGTMQAALALLSVQGVPTQRGAANDLSPTGVVASLGVLPARYRIPAAGVLSLQSRFWETVRRQQEPEHAEGSEIGPSSPEFAEAVRAPRFDSMADVHVGHGKLSTAIERLAASHAVLASPQPADVNLASESHGSSSAAPAQGSGRASASESGMMFKVHVQLRHGPIGFLLWL